MHPMHFSTTEVQLKFTQALGPRDELKKRLSAHLEKFGACLEPALPLTLIQSLLLDGCDHNLQNAHEYSQAILVHLSSEQPMSIFTTFVRCNPLQG